ncbi:hypothetical protein IVB12_15880 [Bradyrhizobium sp. 179]|uniref:hypothetical protein n=1 Tax=Bradyrhizobium sp. 179 TaxID=2782648 RepID=UPI001FF8E3BF|nr:hypothetical protein [Bradyrhizobium sp. 179]MCK1543396.1 hypothetical protein [Bradyrhizobium sp. 179]
MLKYLAFLALLSLTACGGGEGYGRYEPPVVDSYGKKPEQLAKDQHECIEQKRANGFVGDARMVTNCMEQRGYTILTPKG